MKKLILILFCLISLCFIITRNTFASSKKYSVETNRGYKGMVGCFDYMMETCNSLDDKDIVKERERTENKLKKAHNEMGPVGKEMIEYAFYEEMGRATTSLKELIKKGDHLNREKCKMCIDELNRLKIFIGIK